MKRPMYRFLTAENMALLTDMYELTMAASYFDHGLNGEATFDLFMRKMPPSRGYLISAGLEHALYYLEHVRFTPWCIDRLRELGRFKDDFLDFLRAFRFSGEVRAIPEGRICFPLEPMVEVSGPLIEAQLVETFLLNVINFETAIATKASRVVQAACGREVADFSLRRTHGADAGLKVARASCIGGVVSTSNVLGGVTFGVPTAGTMAHSYIMAFEDEAAAFRAFAHSFPDTSILLIDTYDTIEGARRAVEVARDMEQRGKKLAGVRLDSGDMAALSKEVRAILDDAGLKEVKIFASGSLNEERIDEMLRRGACIDAFGVGTDMGVSWDYPSFDAAYKLVEYEGRPVMKLSTGKVSFPGRKQVFRRYDEQGEMVEDIVAASGEEMEGAEPLLESVMTAGAPIGEVPSLEAIRERCERELARLPERYKDLHKPGLYPVAQSPRLARSSEAIARTLRDRFGA